MHRTVEDGKKREMNDDKGIKTRKLMINRCSRCKEHKPQRIKTTNEGVEVWKPNEVKEAKPQPENRVNEKREIEGEMEERKIHTSSDSLPRTLGDERGPANSNISLRVFLFFLSVLHQADQPPAEPGAVCFPYTLRLPEG